MLVCMSECDYPKLFLQCLNAVPRVRTICLSPPHQCFGSGSAAKFGGAHGSISSLRNMKMLGMGRRLSLQRALIIRIKT